MGKLRSDQIFKPNWIIRQLIPPTWPSSTRYWNIFTLANSFSLL